MTYSDLQPGSYYTTINLKNNLFKHEIIVLWKGSGQKMHFINRRGNYVYGMCLDPTNSIDNFRFSTNEEISKLSEYINSNSVVFENTHKIMKSSDFYVGPGLYMIKTSSENWLLNILTITDEKICVKNSYATFSKTEYSSGTWGPISGLLEARPATEDELKKFKTSIADDTQLPIYIVNTYSIF